MLNITYFLYTILIILGIDIRYIPISIVSFRYWISNLIVPSIVRKEMQLILFIPHCRSKMSNVQCEVIVIVIYSVEESDIAHRGQYWIVHNRKK